MKIEPVILLFKSHVETYTRKDGTVVRAHDDRRAAAKPKQQSHDEWESSVAAKVAEKLDISHSDAESLVDAQSFAMQQSWGRGHSVDEAAQAVIAAGKR